MIGTGKQAIQFYKKLIAQRDPSHTLKREELRKLRQTRKYYLALVGFENGINEIKKSRIFEYIFVSEILKSAHKAFSMSNKIFESPDDIKAAKEIAEFYGNCLYPRRPDSDGELGPGPMGYGDCEALIVFHYNTPNNTLPILWKEGKIGYREWYALFPRRE